MIRVFWKRKVQAAGRKLPALALIVTVVFGLCACSADTAQTGKSDDESAVEQSVSMGVVRGSEPENDFRESKEEHTSFSEKALWNSTNYYKNFSDFADDNGYFGDSIYYVDGVRYKGIKEGLVQYDTAGTNVKVVLSFDAEEDIFCDWLYVDDTCIVYLEEGYIDDDDDIDYTICYEVPLKKGADGKDEVFFENRRKLFAFKDSEVGNVYVDEDYIIGDEDGKYFRYVRKTKELVRKTPFKKEKGEHMSVDVLDKSAGTAEIYVSLHRESDTCEDILYCQNLRTMEWKELIAPSDDGICSTYYEGIASDDGTMLIWADEAHGPSTKEAEKQYTYYLRNYEKDTIMRVAGNKLCEKLLIEEKAVDKKELQSCDMNTPLLGNYRGYSDGRFYFDAVVETRAKKTALARRAVFSVSERDGKLTYEKELTGHMWELGTYKHISTGVMEDEIEVQRANLAMCYVQDGEALICYETKTGAEAAIYNLATKEDKKSLVKDKKWAEIYKEMELEVESKTGFLTAYFSSGFEKEVVYEE